MKLAMLMLCVLPAPGAAEEEIVRIENWRVQPGDDLRWAQPDYDDSEWTQSSWPRRHTSEQEFFAGVRWYRATAVLPLSLAGQPLAIALPPVDEVFDVFVNGIRVGTSGSWEPAPAGPLPRFLSFRIPNEAGRGPLHVAIRRWTGGSRTNFISLASDGSLRDPHAPEIGPAVLMPTRQKLRAATALNAYAPNLVAAILFVGVGLLSVALFFSHRATRENLWLGLALMLEGVPPLLGFAAVLVDVPLRSPAPAAIVGLQLSPGVLWAIFLAGICPRLRIPLGLASVVQAINAVAFSIGYATQLFLPYGVLRFSTWVGVAAPVAVAVVLLTSRREAHSTLLSVTLMLLPAAQIWFTQVSNWFGIPQSGRFFYLGPFIIDPRTIAKLLFAITALAVLYLRHRRERERQSDLTREMAAARLVQESLLVARRAETPGFAVETAYLPASEVGGDFYHVLPAEDGSVLVLVGDVSGKGMRAALLVGHISGALSNEQSRRPREVLVNLNASLTGRVNGGFVTCCCARMDPDGAVTIASAGHLSPYAGGREIAVEPGLPLGVVESAEYVEVRATFTNGEPFVLISDGVAEAANSKGELFGFHKTREISTHPACDIAETARRWGQNDDITVVRVQRAATA